MATRGPTHGPSRRAGAIFAYTAAATALGIAAIAFAAALA
jgi:hypothetical protein